MKINEQAIAALATLRKRALGGPSCSCWMEAELVEAINTLDNADVFADIDEAAWANTACPRCGDEMQRASHCPQCGKRRTA